MSSLLLASLLVRLGPSADPPYELQWRVPSSCPEHGSVTARVDEFIGEHRDDHVFVVAEADVEAVDGSFTLTLRTTTDSGSRERIIESPDCEELAAATALLLAIAVEPGPPDATETDEPIPSPAPAPSPRPEGSAKPTPVDPTPSAEATDTPRPPTEPTASNVEPTPTSSEPAPVDAGPARFGLRGYAVAEVGVSVGLMPAVTPSFRVGGGIGGRRWRLGVNVLHRLHRSVETVGGARARLGTLSGSLQGCGVPSLRDVRFPLCLGAEVGGIGGSSGAVANPRRGWGPLLAVHARGGAEIPISEHVGLALQASAVLPVIRAIFEVDGIGELHRVGPVAFDGGLSLLIYFW